jgi:hypothetical protein
LAIKPDLFMDMSEFKARLQYLYDRVVGSDKMHGVERIYFPGELEQICAKVGFAASRWLGWEVERWAVIDLGSADVRCDYVRWSVDRNAKKLVYHGYRPRSMRWTQKQIE